MLFEKKTGNCSKNPLVGKIDIGRKRRPRLAFCGFLWLEIAYNCRGLFVARIRKQEMDNLKVIGKHEASTIAQMETCLQNEFAVGGVLCADGHKGYAQPIGGVVAYYDSISLSGVGFDIACGNLAVKTDATWSDLRSKHKIIADAIAEKVSFGVGRSAISSVDHSLFDDEAWKIKPINQWKELARSQLSSIGSGNHYADVFIDQDEIVWVGVHFGSRGLGHKIATNYLLIAGGRDGMDVPPCVVHERSSIGSDYLEGMRLAGLYAYAGREAVCKLIVEDILKAKIVDSVHNHHNFAWQEEHDGKKLWVVRKGATPAFPGQRGFVGGSMGDNSVILSGIESEESKANLYSTVHGAGRVMSRTEAAGKQKWIYNARAKKKIPTRVTEGKVNEVSMRQKIANKGIELRGAGADEAPDVYRRLDEVLEFHKDSIKIETILQPKIVVMAGGMEHDPYKD